MLDLLARLVEKSLVALDAEGERYRHAGDGARSMRRSGSTASGEVSAVRDRHLAFYLALAERARPDSSGRTSAEWLARLDHERENILAAHAWCDHADDGGELGLRLVRR